MNLTYLAVTTLAEQGSRQPKRRLSQALEEPFGQRRMMSYYETKYRIFLLLGDPSYPELWKYSTWKNVEEDFEKLLISKRGPANVRSTQIDLNTKKKVSFGRILWGAKANQKWLHDSPVSGADSTNWLFCSLETWMPSWTECEKQKKSPDIFFNVLNEASGRSFKKSPFFNPLVLIAISEDLYDDSMLTPIGEIKSKTSGRLFNLSDRPWGVAHGGGFTDSIQDFLLVGLFRPGPVHDGRPVEEKFRTLWKELSLDEVLKNNSKYI